MARIHPTAVVHPRADLGARVVVGPFCYVGEGVRIGEGTELVAFVTALGATAIGRDNQIFPHAVLGSIPQDLKYRGEETTLTIGDRNVIREGVTMNIGTESGGGRTTVGDDNLLMAYCHVAHDCRVGNGVIFANGVLLGGHIEVEDHAVIGGNAALQHYSTVGTMAFVGGMSRVVHDAPPYLITEGNPARPRGVNQVKLKRMGATDEAIDGLWEAYRVLYRGGEFAKVLEQMEAEPSPIPEVRRLCVALRGSLRGRQGRSRELMRPLPTTAVTPS